jgi:hypothetical protein
MPKRPTTLTAINPLDPNDLDAFAMVEDWAAGQPYYALHFPGKREHLGDAPRPKCSNALPRVSNPPSLAWQANFRDRLG